MIKIEEMYPKKILSLIVKIKKLEHSDKTMISYRDAKEAVNQEILDQEGKQSKLHEEATFRKLFTPYLDKEKMINFAENKKAQEMHFGAKVIILMNKVNIFQILILKKLICNFKVSFYRKCL